jgi:hypothetical protein
MRSLQEISKNLSGNLKIEIPSCKLILVSPICSHFVYSTRKIEDTIVVWFKSVVGSWERDAN